MRALPQERLLLFFEGRGGKRSLFPDNAAFQNLLILS